MLEMVNVMLEDLTHRCFLSRDMNGVKACIDTIMQCTLDFRAHLSTASQEGDSNSSNLINDNLFVKAWFLIFLMLLCLDLNSILLSRNLESAWSFSMDSCACQHWVTSRNCVCEWEREVCYRQLFQTNDCHGVWKPMISSMSHVCNF